MSKKITEIEGIGPAYAEKLLAANITTVEGLLESGGTKKGRKELVETTGISNHMLLTWINKADLMRIKGVGEEYSDLLVCAGVDTVPELAQRNAANLTAKLTEINEEKKLVRAAPYEKTVQGWVEQAKELPRAIFH